MENSLLFDFGKIWPRPCTIVQGLLLSNFRVTLEIYEKSRFNRNQLKVDTQHKNMYMYQKMKMKISLFVVFVKIPLYYTPVLHVLVQIFGEILEQL